MNWVDLSIACLFLWGGITGYAAGWKRTFCRLLALVVAIIFAAVFKSNMSMVIGEHFPFEQSVKEAVDGRLAIPAGTAPVTYPVLLANLDVPPVLYRPLLERQVTFEPVSYIYLGDRLTRIMTELVAFMVMFMLWRSALGLLVWIYSKRPVLKLSLFERWGGAAAGVLGQVFFVALLLGLLSPLLWLVGLEPDLTMLEKGRLARMGFQLFERFKLF